MACQTVFSHRHFEFTNRTGPLGKLLALALGLVLLVLAFMFSVVLLVVAAVVGAAVWGYVWWKTRALRRAMREHVEGGFVIEGEGTVIDEATVVSSNKSPDRE